MTKKFLLQLYKAKASIMFSLPSCTRIQSNDEYESLSKSLEKESICKKCTKSILITLTIISIALLILFSNTSRPKHGINRATVDGNSKPYDQSTYTVKARAEFNGFGISGYVEISEGGFVSVDVNVSEIEINSMNTICGENNLEYAYHLHDELRTNHLTNHWITLSILCVQMEP